MSEILSLEWTDTGVRGVVARVVGGQVAVQSVFDAAWPAELDPAAEAVRAGAWLREQVAAAGFRGREARVCVPRSAAVVRRLDLPAVPAAELPQMVRMQAATRASSALEQQALDFVPISAPDAETECSVLAATIPRPVVETIQHVCAAAQLVPVRIGLASLAVAELVVRHASRERAASDLTELVVTATVERLQATLIRHGRLVFTQSSELHVLDDDALGKTVAASINRTLLANGDGTTARDLTHLWAVGGSDSAAWLAALGSRFSVPIERLDPLVNGVVSLASGVEVAAPGEFAGAVGNLLADDEPLIEQLDFLNPRRPPREVDHTRRRATIAAAAAAVLLLTGWLLWWSRLAALDDRIEQLARTESELATYTRERAETRTAAAAVRSWDRLRIDWIGELDALRAQMPDRSTLLLDELHAAATPTVPEGELRADVRARDRATVEDLTQSLAEAGYEVEPAEVRTDGVGERPYRFPLELRLPDETASESESESEEGGRS